MTDPTHPTLEELKDIAAEEDRDGVVDQQTANAAATGEADETADGD